MSIPISLHWQNEGFDLGKAWLEQVSTTTIKFIMDADFLNDPAKMELLAIAQAKGCLIVGRRWYDVSPDLGAADAKLEARRYFNGIGPETQGFRTLSQLFPMVGVWEGPNEMTVTTPAQMQWYAAFCAELSMLMMTEANRRAGVGSWAVGTPDLALWQWWRPVLDATRSYQAILTRHSYGPIAGDEGTWYGLRHRRDQEAFRQMGYLDVPLLLTECGVDNLPQATCFNQPWRKIWGYEDDAIYRYWNDYLKLFTEEIGRDAYVLGAHLFTCGNGGDNQWDVFDVAHLPLPDAVAKNPPVIKPTPVPPVPPVPPTPDPWPAWATHQVTARVLNVRQFPWVGNVEPPKVGQFEKGKYLQALAVAKLPGMAFGWYLVGPDGNLWVSGKYLTPKPASEVPIKVEVPVTPENTLYASKGIVGQSFSVEKLVVKVNEPLWFNFKVFNSTFSPVAYAILAARTVEGQCAQSWTNEKLNPAQVLEWRDHMEFSTPGTYHVYLGIGYDDKDACLALQAPWYRLSQDVVVTVR